MAGHSKFKNIQHRKGAQDKKRAKVFTKLVREIITAAKIGGTEPENNPRLRTAISAARSQNLPKERIERALAQASDPSDLDNYSENRYEGFLPGGVALIVETLTDNKNRTVAEVRSAFSKYGGNLAENGSVAFMFNRLGRIIFNKGVATDEKIFEDALECGATDVASYESEHVIYTDVESFIECVDKLQNKYGDAVESEIIWQAQNDVEVNDEEQASKIIKMIDSLEESDDVQKVFGNYVISQEIYDKIS